MAGIILTVEKTGQFFGVTPQTVRNWIGAGLPAQKDERGKWGINSAEVSEWLQERERRAVLGDAATLDQEEAKRRKLAAEAGLAELELAKQEGKVIAIDTAKTDVESQIARCRARLLSLPAKVAPLVIGTDDPNEAREIIETAVYEALSELSGGHVDEQPEVAA